MAANTDVTPSKFPIVHLMNAPRYSGRWTDAPAIHLIFKVDCRRRSTVSVRMLVVNLMLFRPGLNLVSMTVYRPMVSKSKT